MTIATKSGSLILKDGRLATNCNCCAEVCSAMEPETQDAFDIMIAEGETTLLETLVSVDGDSFQSSPLLYSPQATQWAANDQTHFTRQDEVDGLILTQEFNRGQSIGFYYSVDWSEPGTIRDNRTRIEIFSGTHATPTTIRGNLLGVDLRDIEFTVGGVAVPADPTSFFNQTRTRLSQCLSNPSQFQFPVTVKCTAVVFASLSALQGSELEISISGIAPLSISRIIP
jgi:hypothetical protein